MPAATPSPGGIVCPLVTPWTPDGRLDEPVFRDLIDALVPDLDGLFLLGSSGELTWLPDELAASVVGVAVDQVAGRVPVYVGVGDTGERRTLDRTARLTDAGVDFIVVAPPFYYAVDSEAAVVDYFATIADAATRPVVLYNIPQNTHLALAPSVVRTLAVHPNIVGMKDSAGDWFAFRQYLGARSETFRVLQGREQLTAISLWSGADGVISGLANVAPRLLRALAGAVRDERPRAEVLELQATVDELATVFELGYWLAGLKCTLETLGWPVGDPGRPIPPYDATQAGRVAEIVARPGLRPWLTAAEPAAVSIVD